MFPTKEDIHGIKRRAVLREAAASFNHKGYHGTSLNEIAASLGVTKAALYHYFPNKNSAARRVFRLRHGGCLREPRARAQAGQERARAAGADDRAATSPS